MHIISNNLHVAPEAIFIFQDKSDSNLVTFVQEIAIENEDTSTTIKNVDSAKNYLREHCDNLTYLDADEFWNLLGDVPVNDDEEIDDDFLIFDKGCDVHYIWSWFEETYDTQIGGNYIN